MYGSFEYGDITNELKNDFTYIIVKTSIDNIRCINKNTYIAVSLADLGHNEYVLISKSNIIDTERFKLSLQELEKRNIKI